MIQLQSNPIHFYGNYFTNKTQSTNCPISANNTLERVPNNDTVNIDIENIQKKQKEEYIKNSPLLTVYNDFSKELEYRDSAINVLEFVDLNGLKEIEEVCKIVQENTKPLYNGNVDKESLKNFVDLYYYDKECFNYCLNSDVVNNIFMSDFRSNECVKILTIPMAKEIEKGKWNKTIEKFVIDSDDFYKDPENSKKLSEILRANKTTGDLIVYRGEKHVGQFSDVPIGKMLTKKIKFANFLYQLDTKNKHFTRYEKKYHLRKKDTIYNHIKNSKELSLSDAMLMMKYMDKYTQKEIIELIKSSNLKDDGSFKSTTLSEDFAKSWVGSVHNYAAEGQPTIIDKINLTEGTEGIYVQGEKKGDTNGQFEFIINNNPKEYTIKDVSYNKEENRFNIEYDVQNK